MITIFQPIAPRHESFLKQLVGFHALVARTRIVLLFKKSKRDERGQSCQSLQFTSISPILLRSKLSFLSLYKYICNSRNNKSGRGVTLFMGLLYGDDALGGWPNMSQSVAAISPLRAIVEGARVDPRFLRVHEGLDTLLMD